MAKESIKNANRFLGFADTYEEARPKMPSYPIKVIERYLDKKPEVVIDIGCGTGLSTTIWENSCNCIIGVEPSEDMLSIAMKKKSDTISFIKAFSHNTGLDDSIADVIICSQSFHWMDPVETLIEVNRLLKPDGIFATVDCDWPPLCNWKVEKAYNQLFHEVRIIEEKNLNLKNNFRRWDKNKHLKNIEKSNFFRFTNEMVFSNEESCNAERYIKLALSQGGLQSILKTRPLLILTEIERFKEAVLNNLPKGEFNIEFSYRMRIGVK